MSTSPVHQIALSLLPNIGPRLTRKLVAYVGSIEGVLSEKKSSLLKVPGLGEGKLANYDSNKILLRAENELNYMHKHHIDFSFYLDSDYPYRLKECEDGPVVLYHKGAINFNAEKVVGIVGTRNATSYGEGLCEDLVAGLAEMFPELVVVSGFAYGIDICAHKSALKSGLYTTAVFGVGIETIYPAAHRKYINQMLEQGGCVSEFPSDQKGDPGNFVSRNRIIAGLSDATIVVESGLKGGSLLTADMAMSYNRDVFAFPGRVGDPFSSGCNKLIRNNTAALIESANDLAMAMKWDQEKNQKPKQAKLFVELTPEEEAVVAVIKKNESITIDLLSRALSKPVSSLSAMLLKLEFDGVVSSLPGKNYRLK